MCRWRYKWTRAILNLQCDVELKRNTGQKKICTHVGKGKTRFIPVIERGESWQSTHLCKKLRLRFSMSSSQVGLPRACWRWCTHWVLLHCSLFCKLLKASKSLNPAPAQNVGVFGIWDFSRFFIDLFTTYTFFVILRAISTFWPLIFIEALRSGSLLFHIIIVLSP